MNGRRLAAVLRVRELQERQARGELARTNEQLRHAAEAERSTWTALDRPSSRAAWSSQQLGAHHAVRAAGTLAADSQHLITEHAEVCVDEAAGVWTVAARRVEALERLGERNRETEAIESERQRNNELDDMVLARRGRTGPSGGTS
jgi:flagellar export protein FliJ